MKFAKPLPEDFENAKWFLLHLEILSREMYPHQNTTGSHRWLTVHEDYADDFKYCTIDGELDFESFIQYWDKRMAGGLF